MATDRIKQLEKFYEEDPLDPFNSYALALEYLHSDTRRSQWLFETLLEKHMDYLPTYYHAARLYQDLGQSEKAIRTYKDGIALARRLNDAKALRELQSAYNEMMFE
jgi:tetratricopeptide (TPR) repeat protein